MSVTVNAVAPLSIDTAVLPVGGSTSSLNSTAPIVVTDPGATSSNPVNLEITEGSGQFRLAAGTSGVDVRVTAGAGANDAEIVIGLADDGAGNTLANGGSSVQVDDDYAGSVTVNYDNAITDGTKVDLNTAAIGGETIGSNAPPVAAGNTPDYYINTGAGDDNIQGSQFNDFIRAGAGSDAINAGAGNDIVRGGADSDEVTLGPGDDIYYFTVDQLIGTSTDTITDFDADGNDQIQIDKTLNDDGRISISGIGTNRIVITLSGSETGKTTVLSGSANTIDNEDIAFV